MDAVADAFRVRAAGYLETGVKQRPTGRQFALVETRLAASAPPDPPPGEDRRIAIDFTCPRGLQFSLLFREVGRADDALLDRLFEGDDDFARRRLKLIPVCTEGPWVVRWIVGRPAILARALTTTFRRGPGWVRVAVDVTSSRVACGIFGRVCGALPHLVLDLGFVLEATDADDLPERLLCGCRLDRVDFRALTARVARGEVVLM